MGVISRGERIDGRWKTRRKSFPSTKKIKREGKRRISAASFFYKANNPTKRSLEEAKFDLLDPFALFSPFSESEAKRIANKRSRNVDLTLLVSREGGEGRASNGSSRPRNEKATRNLAGRRCSGAPSNTIFAIGSSGDGRIPPLAAPIDRRVGFVVGRRGSEFSACPCEKHRREPTVVIDFRGARTHAYAPFPLFPPFLSPLATYADCRNLSRELIGV